MEGLLDIHKIRNLQERYPFVEEELEILVRCHEHLQGQVDNKDDDFLITLAHASPYTFFFLPGDELRVRVEWIEEHILPEAFAQQLQGAMTAPDFVEYASQGEEKELEQFLEGVASTGRRGSKEALRMLYRMCGGSPPEGGEILDTCIRLAIASDAFMNPILDKDTTLKRLEDMEPAIGALTTSLETARGNDTLTLTMFTQWAEDKFPMLSTTLSTFVHALLFHGRPFPNNRIQYEKAKLDTNSNIFSNPNNSPSLLALSMMSERFRGKWHRIYSSFLDGRSFHRLAWSVLGYTGPTVLLIQTTGRAVLGALAASPWKEGQKFYGNSDCFLFELEPNVNVYHHHHSEQQQQPEGNANFMYLHQAKSDPIMNDKLPRGIGFGGTIDKPRLFIPETLDRCAAHYWDQTYDAGELLPLESLETFEIQYLEVWGVGGGGGGTGDTNDSVITQALRDRADYRERSNAAVQRARTVLDKSAFVEDAKSSGLTPLSIFTKHQSQVRGRHDFCVDDEHVGGYKLDHDAG